METLLLKLIVTPLLIGAASLAGRRWGETLSGWFIGLPLTSGPVCWFLALEQGTGFAAGTIAYAVCGALLQAASLPLWLLASVVCAALATALWLMPRLDSGRAQLPVPPSW